MRLRVLTWNVSFGYGLGSEGIGYFQRPQTHFRDALLGMSELIKEMKADIVFLQEVDFHSRRSHYEDQLGELARMSGLLYHQAIESWNAPYVPYPGLNPKNHFGRIRSGGGVLSRFPIHTVLNELLPKPKENGKLFNFFYLNRYLQIVQTMGLRFCNLHLEAFSEDNRELHLVKLQDRLIDYQIDIAGGDFNGDPALNEGTKDGWSLFPAPEPTFPCPEPNRTLDGFILKNGRFKNISLRTLNSGFVSDHFPVLLEVDVDE